MNEEMHKDKIFAEWLKSTANLIQKYNLDNISIKVEEHFSGVSIDKATFKELIKLNIKDENKYIIKNELYDILDKRVK
jgi:hypothetical protein